MYNTGVTEGGLRQLIIITTPAKRPGTHASVKKKNNSGNEPAMIGIHLPRRAGQEVMSRGARVSDNDFRGLGEGLRPPDVVPGPRGDRRRQHHCATTSAGCWEQTHCLIQSDADVSPARGRRRPVWGQVRRAAGGGEPRPVRPGTPAMPPPAAGRGALPGAVPPVVLAGAGEVQPTAGAPPSLPLGRPDPAALQRDLTDVPSAPQGPPPCARPVRGGGGRGRQGEQGGEACARAGASTWTAGWRRPPAAGA